MGCEAKIASRREDIKAAQLAFIEERKHTLRRPLPHVKVHCPDATLVPRPHAY